VAAAVEKEIRYITKTVNMVADVLKNNGRLFYIGAGTSGRLGVLDAAECPPTFGSDPKTIQGIIAGGNSSLVRSSEGVEDDIQSAKQEIAKRKIGRKDIVIGLSASKRTPFALTGLREAKERGAKTVFVCCNPRKEVTKEFDLAICPVVGPEAVAGSTRMKSGTAQKMILNMITTTTMIKIGKVYQGRMVDLGATSEKLKERSKKTIMDICDIDYENAGKILKKAGGSVKIAIVMYLSGISKAKAATRLKAAQGVVRKAINSRLR
jgi:N-acetylmuramic acid 6-phosphate etherase